MGIIAQIFSVFILGLLGGANPGPILASAFTEALRKGFIKSPRVIFMAMFAETIIALFILVVFFSIKIPEIFFYIISLAGAGVLVWIALQVWKVKEIDEGGEIFSFKRIFLLTVFNGPFWIFWITICVPQAFLLKEMIAGGQFLFLALFELGWLLATLFLTFLFSRFRQFLTKKKLTPFVFKFFAILLLLFAIRLTVLSINFLFSEINIRLETFQTTQITY
jgi:threonine/homoserine/homoserine lactone efflux protein